MDGSGFFKKTATVLISVLGTRNTLEDGSGFFKKTATARKRHVQFQTPWRTVAVFFKIFLEYQSKKTLVTLEKDMVKITITF